MVCAASLMFDRSRHDEQETPAQQNRPPPLAWKEGGRQFGLTGKIIVLVSKFYLPTWKLTHSWFLSHQPQARSNTNLPLNIMTPYYSLMPLG